MKEITFIVEESKDDNNVRADHAGPQQLLEGRGVRRWASEHVFG